LDQLEKHQIKWKVCSSVRKFRISELTLLFSGRSSITRASSFINIADLSEKETMIYLTEKRNLSQDLAKDIYALFGGRIKSLQNTATKVESGVPFSSMLRF
jgi:hypothetical protein